MEGSTLKSAWIGRVRGLSLGLIFSVALNIGLMATVITLSMRRDPLHSQMALIENQTAHFGSVQECVAQMQERTFPELVSFLTNKEGLEAGWTKRDAALSILVGFHAFDLDRALGCHVDPKMECRTEGRVVPLFSGFSEEQFPAIIRFAYEEKWPLTPKGLFEKVQKTPYPVDPDLLKAFAMTEPMYHLQLLFQKTGGIQDISSLVQLVKGGSWELLEELGVQMRQSGSFSFEKRNEVLCRYLSAGSSVAAEVLCASDPSFVIYQLPDRELLFCLDVCQKTPAMEKVYQGVAASHRAEAVREKARQYLCHLGERDEASILSAKSACAVSSPGLVSTSGEVPFHRQHKVEKGESLWKIARQYQVKTEHIVQLNELHSERIYPGMTLLIPDAP